MRFGHQVYGRLSMKQREFNHAHGLHALLPDVCAKRIILKPNSF